MKTTALALTASLLLGGFISQANAKLSANVALATDYVWRGISQNNEDPALQGGFDYEHASGFYLGMYFLNWLFL